MIKIIYFVRENYWLRERWRQTPKVTEAKGSEVLPKNHYSKWWWDGATVLKGEAHSIQVSKTNVVAHHQTCKSLCQWLIMQILLDFLYGGFSPYCRSL